MTLLNTTIRDIAVELPGAIGVFREYRIDFVAGGDLTLRQALSGRRADSRRAIGKLKVLADRHACMDVPASDLILEVLGGYQKVQRRHFLPVIRASRRVEYENSQHADCPWGLAHQLTILTEELGAHQEKEEQGLFQALMDGPGHDMRFPIQRMTDEHDDLLDQLETIRRLTHNFTAPADASEGWRDLYRACKKLDGDLRFHINLENNHLFPRFATSLSVAA